VTAAALQQARVSGGREPLKILVIEDDNAIAKLITMIIEKNGPYSVERANSIAMAQARLEQGGIDAALLDLELPDSSGIETVRRICSNHPELPVVILTSHSESDIAQQALREGAEDFVSKGTSIAIMLDRALRYSLERKRVSRELERQKSLFEAVFRDVPDAMVMSNAHHEIVLCNPGFKNMFGYEPSEVVGGKSEQLLADAESSAAGSRADETLQTEAYTIEYRRKSGETFPGETVHTIMQDIGGKPLGYLSVIRDVSERVRAENALRESERRNREFAADVAHELRTPLAVLRTRLENLGADVRINPLVEHVDEMSRLISQLLAETDLEGLSVTPGDVADLRQVCLRVAQYFAPLVVKQNRMIEVTGSESPVLVNGLEAPLEQAVRNLLQNGLKFSYPNTTVTIDVGEDGSIGVTNFGDAVPDDMQDRIFERFLRADRKVTGSGLGLSIVKRVVDAHNATIELRRTGDGGTQFRIRFPETLSP
jgi:PAS domain S-box-containing protein